MKKIIIGFAIVVMASIVQAATVSWTITNVYGPDGSTLPDAKTYSAYMFVTANTTGVSGVPVTTLATIQGYLEAGNVADAVALSAVNGLNTASGKWTGGTGLLVDSSTKNAPFASGTLTAFVVIFDSTSADTASNYYIVNAGATKDATFNGATGAKTLGFVSQASYTQGDAAASSWHSVPEPTSGLLLLLGMGALALRRKRA